MRRLHGLAVLLFALPALAADPPAGGKVPELIAPKYGAELDNGSMNMAVAKTWTFEWSAVPKATKYHIQVMGPKAKIPAVNTVVAKNKHQETDRGYVIDDNRKDWTWKVRAFVGNKWQDWSEERKFDVKPLGQPAAPPKK